MLLVQALAEHRARTRATAESLDRRCFVCGASRRRLQRESINGFQRHVCGGVHDPVHYAALVLRLYELAVVPVAPGGGASGGTTHTEAWLLECVHRADPVFMPVSAQAEEEAGGEAESDAAIVARVTALEQHAQEQAQHIAAMHSAWEQSRLVHGQATPGPELTQMMREQAALVNRSCAAVEQMAGELAASRLHA